MPDYCQFNTLNETSVKSDSNTTISFLENEFEIRINKIPAICRGPYVHGVLIRYELW